MYNGIGLQTARGSGTSGYVQKSLAYVKPKAKSKDQFLFEMQQIKECSLKPNKKANIDILKHQQKREIYVQLEILREELTKSGKDQKEIEERLKRVEGKLIEQLEKGELQIQQTKDSHLEAQLKEQQYKKLKNTFNISDDYKPGQAFDFQLQEQKKMEKIYLKEKKQLDRFERLKEEAIRRKNEEKKVKKEMREKLNSDNKQITLDQNLSQIDQIASQQKLNNQLNQQDQQQNENICQGQIKQTKQINQEINYLQKEINNEKNNQYKLLTQEKLYESEQKQNFQDIKELNDKNQRSKDRYRDKEREREKDKINYNNKYDEKRKYKRQQKNSRSRSKSRNNKKKRNYSRSKSRSRSIRKQQRKK